MRVSLIVATINRVSELEQLFRSLVAQDHQNFEVVLVDQNADARLESLVADYATKFAITHVRSEKGLSKARNAGMLHATGDIVAFPDDDCWYDRNVLQKVVALLTQHPEWSGVTGSAIDQDGRPTSGRWDHSSGVIGLANIWRRAISFTIFLRRGAARHRFDETLGVGASTPWGAGEETDYLLRSISDGGCVHYERSLHVCHPEPVGQRYTPSGCEKARSYGRGMGRVLRKHKYPALLVGYHLLRPLGGAILSWLGGRTGKARHHFAVLSGRLQGWASKPDEAYFQAGYRSTQV